MLLLIGNSSIITNIMRGSATLGDFNYNFTSLRIRSKRSFTLCLYINEYVNIFVYNFIKAQHIPLNLVAATSLRMIHKNKARAVLIHR